MKTPTARHCAPPPVRGAGLGRSAKRHRTPAQTDDACIKPCAILEV